MFKIRDMVKDNRLLGNISDYQENMLITKLDELESMLKTYKGYIDYRILIRNITSFYNIYISYYTKRNYSIEDKLLFEMHEYIYIELLKILSKCK